MRALSLLLAVLLAGTAAYADESKIKDPEAANQYQHCISVARNVPQEGRDEAQAWASLGGGEPAHHCQAVALINMRDYDEGAAKLEALAASSQSSARTRAGMLAQAGQARLLAHEPESAITDQSKALLLVPDAPDILVDRAQSHAEQKNYQGALQDLDRSLEISPDRPVALLFRATTKRHLEDLAGARADLDRVLQIDDKDPDAWLEDGVLKGLAGDQAGARISWNKVLEMAPQSEAADTARRDLDLLAPRSGSPHR